MSRLFVLIILSLSFAVTACNGGGKKRVSLKKGMIGEGKNKVSDRTAKLNAAIADPKCLRVDKLVSEVIKFEDESVLIYTAEVDVGTLTKTASDNVKFTGEADTKTRAHAIFQDKAFDPVAKSIPATTLLNGPIESLLNITLDAKCSEASLPGLSPNGFTVVRKNASEILLQNKVNLGLLLLYKYDGINKLTITRYAPTTGVCGKNHTAKMTRYVVAREKATEKVELARGYAEAISAAITAPQELKSALTAEGSAPLALQLTTMDEIKQALQADKFEAPACP